MQATPGINVAGIQFHKAGKIYDFSYSSLKLGIGDFVMVDSERGTSLAQVIRLKYCHPSETKERKLKKIVRKVSIKELEKSSGLTPSYIIDFTKEKIENLELKMKILQAETQFGSNKIIVYFSAPGRVDFRELVKELASGLRARVELKQVGPRDETKLLGGVGICGREYCCSSFLREFVPVSIKMAKNQNLALNPNKVSGGCGRLLCCLTYENDVYTDLKKILPPRGTKVQIEELDQSGTVFKSDLLNQIVHVKLDDGSTHIAPVTGVSVLNKRPSKPQAAASDFAADLDLDALTALANEDSEPTQSKSQPRSQSKPRPPQARSQPRSKPQSQSNSQTQSSGGQDNKKGFNRNRKKKNSPN